MCRTYWMSYLRKGSARDYGCHTWVHSWAHSLPHLSSLSSVALLLILLLAFSQGTSADNQKITIANKMLDSFYRFDAQALANLLAEGKDAESLLYYQAWAEAANYTIKQRKPCLVNQDNLVVCAVTVFDDFGKTLGYTATDTFYLTVESDRVATVSFEGDDPMIFSILYVWMMVFRSELFEHECKDMFEGGKTPAACSRAVVQAAKDFIDMF